MNKKTTLGHKGFTLLEVLVALGLMALVFTLVSVGNFNPRQKIDESLENLERSIRFASDESAIRNAVIRIHFFMEKNPAEFSVEYGPADSFMLPAQTDEPIIKSLADQEKADKEQKKINQKFNRIKEFQEKNAELPDGIRLIAVVTSVQNKLITEGQPSLYMFPTGEKDSGLIIVGNTEEIAGISIDGFSQNYDRVYKKIENATKENLTEIQNKMAEELFKEWGKK